MENIRFVYVSAERQKYLSALDQFHDAALELLKSFPRDGMSNGYPEGFSLSFDELVWEIGNWVYEESQHPAYSDLCCTCATEPEACIVHAARCAFCNVEHFPISHG